MDLRTAIFGNVLSAFCCLAVALQAKSPGPAIADLAVAALNLVMLAFVLRRAARAKGGGPVTREIR